MPSFAGKAHGDNSGSYCGYPALRAYTDNQGNGPIYKRRAPDSRLIISSEPSHNVTELCESETSRGPDFVSLVERLYCNMDTREIKPLCSDDVDEDCFDFNGSQSRFDGDGNGGKEFTEVINWD
ncbi:hypothetical protein BKA64DRAFT_752830 [Cadophora sp. MPI-SDFR-AT-0126]|nr:hypothetical protein BKA64DRAFT_752830 [Leotiomycetes sp. MPI-SDFR-AT-0126]